MVATLGALLVLLYTGMEVMVVQARPLWNTSLLPLIFAVTAMTGGIGMTALFEAFAGNRESAPLLLSLIHICKSSALRVDLLFSVGAIRVHAYQAR